MTVHTTFHALCWPFFVWSDWEPGDNVIHDNIHILDVCLRVLFGVELKCIFIEDAVRL